MAQEELFCDEKEFLARFIRVVCSYGKEYKKIDGHWLKVGSEDIFKRSAIYSVSKVTHAFQTAL